MNTTKATNPATVSLKQRELLQAIQSIQAIKHYDPGGAELARVLGVSRQAVWRRLERLAVRQLVAGGPGAWKLTETGRHTLRRLKRGR